MIDGTKPERQPSAKGKYAYMASGVCGQLFDSREEALKHLDENVTVTRGYRILVLRVELDLEPVVSWEDNDIDRSGTKGSD